VVEDFVTPEAEIRRGAGLALWRQIAAALEREIREGRHAPGARLPTEAALSVRFGVNRHTLRRALEELELRGLLRTEQGRGSFVAEDVLDYPLGPRTRFSEIIRAQNREPAGRILRVGEVAAEPRVAELLGLRPGRRLPFADRLSLADGRPFALGRHHFPPGRFPRILEHLGEDPSITRALALSGVPDYRRRLTRITARLPSIEEAQMLEQSRARPILLCEALNEDMEGRPVEAVVTRYAAGRTQLVVES
jgi:GntR family phosphonate transport system transcriptional regulator